MQTDAALACARQLGGDEEGRVGESGDRLFSARRGQKAAVLLPLPPRLLKTKENARELLAGQCIRKGETRGDPYAVAA